MTDPINLREIERMFRDERHLSYSETVYWCQQYKQTARALVALVREAQKLFVDLLEQELLVSDVSDALLVEDDIKAWLARVRNEEA